ncbi:HNH endonuclease [Polymorphospora lycopeni]|uniref:HNH endonuclease n=1 Tax=Polymorphospora lycopeni TaxID=3140240 RepID=A0ABV5CKQ5_9ACTN
MSLPRRTPLSPMSGRRRAQYAVAGLPIPFSTLARSGHVRESKPVKSRRPKVTGPDKATVAAVIARDGGCVRCGRPVSGQRGVDYSIHHRRLRSQGGDNSLTNLIVLCGDGVRGDHGWAHHNRTAALDLGLIVSGMADPAEAPVSHRQLGSVFLLVDGLWLPHVPSCGDELHGADGGACPGCGWDSHPIPPLPAPPVGRAPWEV